MELQTPQSYRSSSRNDYRKFELKDREGLIWIAKIETTPHTAEGKTSWTASVTLKCSATSSELSNTHTLDPEHDKRLLKLIGKRSVHFTSTTKIFEARTEEQVLRLATASRHEFQKELHDPLHIERKKKVIAVWVDRWLQFG